MSTRGSSSLSLPYGHFLKWVLLLLLLTVLKPLSAECHVIMDQSSEIVLDTPKVNKKESRKNCLQDTQFSLNVHLLWWKKKMCFFRSWPNVFFRLKVVFWRGTLKFGGLSKKYHPLTPCMYACAFNIKSKYAGNHSSLWRLSVGSLSLCLLNF